MGVTWYTRYLPPYLKTLLLALDSEMAAVVRRAQEPTPGPAIGGPMGSDLGVGRGGGAPPPGQCRVLLDGNPCPNPHHIHLLCLLPGENTHDICQNVALPILGGAELCKHWHVGFS